MRILTKAKTLINPSKLWSSTCWLKRIAAWIPRNGLSTYSVEEQRHIIKAIQKCVANNITRPHLNKSRLLSLKPFFEQNPNIEHLEPLLAVNGIGPKTLHRICDSLLNLNSLEELSDSKDIGVEEVKLPVHLITPPIIYQSEIKSVVSIHLGINAVSWARLQTSGSAQLDRWQVMELSDFAEKKYDVHSVWDLVMQCRNQIPDGDVYVMENSNWSNVTNVKKPMKYHIQEAMITTAICSIFNQVDSRGVPREEVINRLYFIRTFTPSRLFNKIVGAERVSAQDVVLNMIEGVPDSRHQPVTFADGTSVHYLSRSGSERDNMCRSLLLAISFAELIIYHNPVACDVISKTAKVKKKSLTSASDVHSKIL